MAAGPIFNAIADLTRISQHRTLERIVSLSGATTSAVVASLKANVALLVMSDDNVSLKTGTSDFETAVTTLATTWNNT
jgi:hypothetical protein